MVTSSSSRLPPAIQSPHPTHRAHQQRWCMISAYAFFPHSPTQPPHQRQLNYCSRRSRRRHLLRPALRTSPRRVRAPLEDQAPLRCRSAFPSQSAPAERELGAARSDRTGGASSAATTPATAAAPTSLSASSTTTLIQSLYTELKTLEAQIAALEAQRLQHRHALLSRSRVPSILVLPAPMSLRSRSFCRAKDTIRIPRSPAILDPV
jgi:hypothetical protein